MLIDKLFESPDNITIDGNIHKWDDQTSKFTFGYLGGDFCGEFDVTHPQLCEIYDAYGFDKFAMDYPGRVWVTYKIITFWEYPKDLEKLKNIIKDIENKSKLKIWDNGYKIEIVTSGKLYGKHVWSKNIETEFINIEDYEGSETWSPFIKQYGHGNEKNKESFGSVKYAKDKPLKYRQHLQTESASNTFTRNGNSTSTEKLNGIGIGIIKQINDWLNDKAIGKYIIEPDYSVTILSPEYSYQMRLEHEKPSYIKFNYEDPEDELIIKCGANDVERVKLLMKRGISFEDFLNTTIGGILMYEAGDVATFIHDNYPNILKNIHPKSLQRFISLVDRTKNKEVNEAFRRGDDDKLDTLGVGRVRNVKLFLEEFKIRVYRIEPDYSITLPIQDFFKQAELEKNKPAYIKINYESKDEELILRCILNDLPRVKTLIDQGANVSEFPGTTMRGMINNNSEEVASYMYDNYSYMLFDSATSGTYKEFTIFIRNIRNKGVNESFKRGSGDKLKDLGIGKISLIKKWLENHDIIHYIIEEDGSVTLNSVVYNKQVVYESICPSYIKFNYTNKNDALIIYCALNDLSKVIPLLKAGATLNNFSGSASRLMVDFNAIDVVKYMYENGYNYMLSCSQGIKRMIEKIKLPNIDESFSRNSTDKIKSLGVGKYSLIKNWMNLKLPGGWKYEITDENIVKLGTDCTIMELANTIKDAPDYMIFKFNHLSKMPAVYFYNGEIDKMKESLKEYNDNNIDGFEFINFILNILLVRKDEELALYLNGLPSFRFALKDSIYKNIFDNYLTTIQKNTMDESFTKNNEDKLNSLGVGKITLIKKWLENKSIRDYTLNDDLSINYKSGWNQSFAFEKNKPSYITFRYLPEDAILLYAYLGDIDKFEDAINNVEDISAVIDEVMIFVKNNHKLASWLNDRPEFLQYASLADNRWFDERFPKNENIDESFSRDTENKLDSLGVGKEAHIKNYIEELKKSELWKNIDRYDIDGTLYMHDIWSIKPILEFELTKPIFIKTSYLPKMQMTIAVGTNNIEMAKNSLKKGGMIEDFTIFILNEVIKNNWIDMAKFIIENKLAKITTFNKGKYNDFLIWYKNNKDKKINETFARDTEDKLKVIGIGKEAAIKHWVEKNQEIGEYTLTDDHKVMWHSGSPFEQADMERKKPPYIEFVYEYPFAKLKVFSLLCDIDKVKEAYAEGADPRVWPNNICVITMDADFAEGAIILDKINGYKELLSSIMRDKFDTYLKTINQEEPLDESFSKNENNDKIKALGLGKIAKIKEWMEEHDDLSYTLTKDHKIMFTGGEYYKQAELEKNAPDYIEFIYVPYVKLIIFTILHDIDKVKEAYAEGVDVSELPNNLWQITYKDRFKEGLEILREVPDFRDMLTHSFQVQFDDYFAKIDEENKLDESFNFQSVKDFVTKVTDKSKTIKSLIEKFNESTDKQTKLFIVKVLIVLFTAVNAGDISNAIVDASSEIYHLMSKDKISVSDFKQKENKKFKNPLNLKISQEGINFIKNHEKLRLKAYKIGDGKITVGWGCAFPIHKSKIRVGQRITFEQAEKLLAARLQVAENGVKRMFEDWSEDGHFHKVTQSMFDSMVSMMFNMGVTGFRNLDLTDDLKNGDFHKAAEKMPTSNLVDGMGGIEKRRIGEQKLFTKELKDYKMK